MKKSRYSPEQMAYGISERRACQVLILPRASHRYRSVADEKARMRLRTPDGRLPRNLGQPGQQIRKPLF